MDSSSIAAKVYLQSGLSVIPIRCDGSKSPALPGWDTYKKRLPKESELMDFFRNPHGVAVINGRVSGNLETIDFEELPVFEEWQEMVKAVQPDLLEKLVITKTPGKRGSAGRHVRYRVKDFEIPGNTKLARRNNKDTIIETRGEGGYALAPGSPPAAHPENRMYENLQGKLSLIQFITATERDILIECAKALNEYIEEKQEYEPAAVNGTGDRPGDRFNQTGDFTALLKHGWRIARQNETRICWTRPGKDGPGISATSGYCKGKDGTPRLYVFSTNAHPFESERSYSPFAVKALLEFSGDYKAAARSLIPDFPQGKVTIREDAPEGIESQEEPQTDDIERALFPTGVFPERLQNTITQIAETIGCSTDPVGCLMLAIASIGVGNTRKIAHKRTWHESASLYLAVVAYPGEGKSPILNELAKPLYQWQHSQADCYKQKMMDYEEEKEKYETAKKAGNAGVPPMKPVFPHVYTSDVTTEKLAEILHMQPRGVGMIQDEVTALVQGMNQYKQGGKGRDRQFYLSAWSSSAVKVDRKADNGVPLIVPHPWVSILGGIQPEMLGALKDEFGREDGFVHRFLFSYPPRRFLKPWDNIDVDQKAIDDWKDCFNKLITLSQHIEPDGSFRPWICPLEQQARAYWKAWYDKMAAQMAQMEAQYNAPSHKLIAYAGRLALIMQMLRWACHEADDKTIDQKSIEAGCHLADYFANHLRLVYGRLHEKPDDAKARELALWISKKGGKVSVRDIVQFGPAWARKYSVATKTLQDLEDREKGTLFENTCKQNGKKTRWFELSPESKKVSDQ